MYKVTCLYNGVTYTLHDPQTNELLVYDDQLETEDSKPGKFQFSMSYDHSHLDKIVGLCSDIRVYDDTDEIWRGRPIDDGEDLYRMRTFICEGELAFLYDSIQPRRELHDITPLAFFTLLINEHNAQVQGQGPIDKTFRVGIVTVTDSNDSLYRYTNRETTYDCIMDKIIGRLGGHLRVRVSGGIRYLDIVADVETIGDQPIQLGENLLNYARDTDYTGVATACIPLGTSLLESEIEALDAYLTVESVNNGSEIIQISSAVIRYGYICKIVKFPDITEPSNLLTAGQNWLVDGQYADMTLELTAVDLHGLGFDVQPIRINSQVKVISEIHGMNRYFEVSKRTYHLSQPETDTVIFGTRTKTYTSASSKKVTSVERHTEQLRQNVSSSLDQGAGNASDALYQATHGYIVLEPNTGPERMLSMNTSDKNTATKIYKWDRNGLEYSNHGINGPWNNIMSIDGEFSADFVLRGSMLKDRIRHYGMIPIFTQQLGNAIGGYAGYGRGKTGAGVNDVIYGLMLSNSDGVSTPSTIYFVVTGTEIRIVAGDQLFKLATAGNGVLKTSGTFSFTADALDIYPPLNSEVSQKDTAVSGEIQIGNGRIKVNKGLVVGKTDGNGISGTNLQIGNAQITVVDGIVTAITAWSAEDYASDIADIGNINTELYGDDNDPNDDGLTGRVAALEIAHSSDIADINTELYGDDNDPNDNGLTGKVADLETSYNSDIGNIRTELYGDDNDPNDTGTTGKVSALETSISDLQARVSALEGNS